MSKHRYGEPTNPKHTPSGEAQMRYQMAKQAWDDRLGSARVQSANWRLIAFGMVLVTLLSVAGLIYQSSKSRVTPYLVEVEASGKVRLVGAVTVQDWSLSESAKKRELEQWIKNLRSMSSDAQVLKERFASVRVHATQAANMQLDSHFERDNPFARFGTELRTIKISATTTIPGSQNAYRVEWVETVFDERGDKKKEESYVGEIHLTIEPPSTQQALQANPLGVYVSFFDITNKR